MAQSLTPHPRLYITESQIRRLRRPAPRLQACADVVEADGRKYLKSTELDYLPNRHNEHLVRARAMQRQIVTLLVRWRQTNEARYRQAVMDRVRIIDGWEYWSWIAWRQGNTDPLAIFDLSYGEISATLAIIWDWLHDTLNADEKKLLVSMARDRALASYLHQLRDPNNRPRWFEAPGYNWNSVCTGGAGMLGLAMMEEFPEAARAVKLTEQSMRPFMHYLRKSKGGCPEGVGYWNYGMRYALMYLISHENATGRNHPLLRQTATAQSLEFPLDFTPNGVSCGFGDSNHWKPLPIHYEAARRLGRRHVIARLDEHLDRITATPASIRPALMHEQWPHAAEYLLLHPLPRTRLREPRPRKRFQKLYPTLDWGCLADQSPRSNVYMTVRGGSTEVPHSHLDLLSFHYVLGDQSMITSLTPKEYYDTTFSGRRWELFEMAPASKNTLLINGVGIVKPSQVKTTSLDLKNAHGFRMEASAAFGTMRDKNAADFAARIFLMLKDGTALILDRVELPHVGLTEQRMHTYAEAQLKKQSARLRRNGQHLSIAWACDVPSILDTAAGPMTGIEPIPTMLRWRTTRQQKISTLATLLSPGKSAAKVFLTTEGNRIEVAIAQRGRTQEFVFTKRCKPM